MEWPTESEERGNLFIALQDAIAFVFGEGDWKKLGHETGTIDWIDGHPRLLRSLQWRDSDYEGHVFDALEMLRHRNPRSLEILLGNEKIRRRLRTSAPAIYAQYVEGAEPVSDFSPEAITPSLTVLKALENARLLISSGDPIGAIDRVHTAIHGYLIEACRNQSLTTVKTDPGIPDLYKVLREQHPRLRDLGTQSEEINKILRSSSAILDALNPLRNKASLAHPNESLIGEDESWLLINVTRSILHYLDSKLSG